MVLNGKKPLREAFVESFSRKRLDISGVGEVELTYMYIYILSYINLIGRTFVIFMDLLALDTPEF